MVGGRSGCGGSNDDEDALKRGNAGGNGYGEGSAVWGGGFICRLRVEDQGMVCCSAGSGFWIIRWIRDGGECASTAGMECQAVAAGDELGKRGIWTGRMIHVCSV